MSTARRVVHDGHQPLLLQQNATTRDSAQASHVTSTKPNLGSPQVRNRSTSSFTRGGIEPDTSGHPRRKASCSTDFSGARRRPSTASPTSPVYCSPPTSSVRGCTSTCDFGVLLTYRVVPWLEVGAGALISKTPGGLVRVGAVIGSAWPVQPLVAVEVPLLAAGTLARWAPTAGLSMRKLSFQGPNQASQSNELKSPSPTISGRGMAITSCPAVFGSRRTRCRPPPTRSASRA